MIELIHGIEKVRVEMHKKNHLTHMEHCALV